MSTACHDHHHLIVASANSSHDLLLWDSPISSIFSNVSSTSTIPQLQLTFPKTCRCDVSAVSSCDGILLFHIDFRSPLLWNPSIRKFKILPPFLEPPRGRVFYTFGYDHFIDNYKIFATCCIQKSEVNINQWKCEVGVYTMGYDSWRRIDAIPGDGLIVEPGIFVSGSVNWLTFYPQVSYPRVIVSLDLEKESYRKLLTPDLKQSRSTLGVLRDSLCIFTNSVEFLDIWVMKEYGIKESWTKLFSVPYVEIGSSSFSSAKVLYVSEDDQVLLALLVFEEFDYKFVIYNSRNGTFKIPKIQNATFWMAPNVYVENLISPCS